MRLDARAPWSLSASCPSMHACHVKFLVTTTPDTVGILASNNNGDAPPAAAPVQRRPAPCWTCSEGLRRGSREIHRWCTATKPAPRRPYQADRCSPISPCVMSCPRCSCPRPLARRAPPHNPASRMTIVACRSAVARDRQASYGAPTSPVGLNQPSAANGVQQRPHAVPPSPNALSASVRTPTISKLGPSERPSLPAPSNIFNSRPSPGCTATAATAWPRLQSPPTRFDACSAPSSRTGRCQCSHMTTSDTR